MWFTLIRIDTPLILSLYIGASNFQNPVLSNILAARMIVDGLPSSPFGMNDVPIASSNCHPLKLNMSDSHTLCWG
jgi:hypothetical protein